MGDRALGGAFVERGFGLNTFEVHGVWEVDAMAFSSKEFDLRCVGDEVVDGIARLGRGHLKSARSLSCS